MICVCWSCLLRRRESRDPRAGTQHPQMPKRPMQHFHEQCLTKKKNYTIVSFTSAHDAVTKDPTRIHLRTKLLPAVDHAGFLRLGANNLLVAMGALTDPEPLWLDACVLAKKHFMVFTSCSWF